MALVKSEAFCDVSRAYLLAKEGRRQTRNILKNAWWKLRRY
jgi:hypothetical protein